NVLTEKDALGNLTTYSYDIQGRMVGRTDPLTQVRHLTMLNSDFWKISPFFSKNLHYKTRFVSRSGKVSFR
ncbi:MAG: RHS repeat protein, partial [Chitinispirillaceae bacterium]|nr:RHS repeat protein [Chitinispirillaceae bacterium]